MASAGTLHGIPISKTQQKKPPVVGNTTNTVNGHVNQQQQNRAMQQQQQQQSIDNRTTKRIKTEHGDESAGSSPSSTQAASPSASHQTQQHGTNGHQSAASVGRTSSQQMGPPLTSRPSTTNYPSYTNGDTGSPAAAPSPSSQSTLQATTPRVNTGPGRNPYQFGMGLPTPGINFTRTPTTGSFVEPKVSGRQQTPTEGNRNTSRGSPVDLKTSGNNTPAVNSGSRKDGVDQLQDLLSISGVDLRAEEEAAQRNPVARATYNTANAAATGQLTNAPQTRQNAFFLELLPLSRSIHRTAAKNGLRVEAEVLIILSLAAKMRFQNLIEAMVASSRHRTWSSHLRPPPLYEKTGQAMYHEEIHDDPLKLLAALSKVEKIEEQAARQARILKEERESNAAQAAADGEDSAMDGASSGQATPADRSREVGADEVKKKPIKKLGTSASARNMSEDKRLKLANKTAAQALGIGSSGKAWMFSGAGGSSSPFGLGGKQKAGAGGSKLPKPRFAPATTAGKNEDGSANEGLTSVDGNATGSSSTDYGHVSVSGWGDLSARQRRKEEEEKQARRRVNLQDALHALEMERSGGAGRGSGEMILYTTRALGRPPVRKL